MSDVKVYKPQTIKDTPFPNTDEVGLETSQEKGVTYGPSTIKDQPFPIAKTSSNLISSALNTKSRKVLGEFTFALRGAFQVGKYEEGVSGDLRISPDGITARNSSGETTFALDGDTGDAVFSGTITASTIIGGTIIGITITLGGLDNEDGIMQIRDADDVLIIQGDKLGHHYYDVLANELIKVDVDGFHAYDTSANELIKVDEEGLHGYLTGGTEVMRIGGAGIDGYGDAGNTYEFYDAVGGTKYGEIGYKTGDNFFWFNCYGGAGMFFSDDKNIIYRGAGGLGGTGMIIDSEGVIGILSDEAVFLKGAATGSLANSGVFIYDHDTSGYREKTAIVPTSQGYNALYCMESPEVWFMDFYEKEVDSLFIEVTEAPYHKITCDDGWVQIWGKRKESADKRFESKTRKEFDVNNQFWSQAKYGT